jgi:hypothetical protein
MFRKLAALAPLLLVVGCGDRGEETAKADAAPKAVAAAGQTAAGAAPAAVNCSKVKPQSAPAGSPVDDVLGVRLGMSLQDARQVLGCANPVYVFSETEGQWNRGDKPVMRRVMLVGDGGLDDVAVDFAGPKGAERAVRFMRVVEYAEGKEQPQALIRDTIEKKYGAFDALNSYNSNVQAGAAVYSLDGQRLGSTNSDYSQCVNNAGDGISGNVTLSNCGLVVKYKLESPASDRELARRFSVVVFDAMKALRLMDEIEQAHRAKVIDAADPSGAPKM